MRIVETENIQRIYLVKYFDSNSNGDVTNIVFTPSDAFDLVEGFLWDEFQNHKKEDVIDFISNTENPDYIDLYPVGKIDYWSDIYKKKYTDLKQNQYYFRIVRTNIEKVTGIRN